MLKTFGALTRSADHPRVAQAAAKLAFAAALVGLLATGALGVGRHGHGLLDFEVIYAGGRAMLAGFNPYVQAEFAPVLSAVAPATDQTAPYSYPPHAAAIFVPLALLSYADARLVWMFLELLAIGIAAFYACWMLTPVDPLKPLPASQRWLFAALAIGNPIVSNNLWLGQPALLAYAGLIVLWHGLTQKRWLLAGLGLALATLKPQLSVLVVLWLLLTRAYRVLATGALVALVLAAYPLVVAGPGQVVLGWLARLQSHTSFVANMPGSEHAIGLRSLLHAADLPVPGLELVGVLLVLPLWWFGRRLRQTDVLGVLMGLTLLFVFNMDSAYVCVIPVLAALWPYARQQRHVLWVTLALGLTFVFPRRVVRMSEIAVLNHWRTLVVLAMLCLLLALASKLRTRGLEPAPAG